METCTTCLKNETPIQCGLCHETTCKQCARFLSDEAFAFLTKRPEHLEHDTYCPSCFETKVANDLASYEEALEKAGDINVYFKDQSKETRLIPRLEKLIHIPKCDDRDELVMRLAFYAAQKGYNALIDVDLVPSKENQGGRYRKIVWRGSGVPANVNPKQIPLDRSIWHQPN